MEKHFLKTCSMLLVIVLLVNMLPMGVFAENFQNSITNTELVTDETATEEVIPEDAHVVAEITENRTEYSKEFLLSNGLHMATVYADAVHYETENGWEEIDNTLKTNADGTYSNTAGVWDVTFPEQLGEDESISIKKDGYTLSFFLSGELTEGSTSVMSAELSTAPVQAFAVTEAQLATGEIQRIDISAMLQSAEHPETVPDKLQSQIAYAEVYDNTDIVYDLDSNKVKESMILESYNADLQGYSYTLEVGTMIPVLEEDGSVTLYDETQENIVMVMPAPYLVDDSGEHNYDIQVYLEGHGSTYSLIYLLPQAWLAAEDRAWPVVLDPAIIPELTTSNIRDRTVAERYTYAQNAPTNICGYASDRGIMQAYLKYSELPQITSSDVVIHAEIRMVKYYESNTITPIEVHKVLGDGNWDSSTITWANKPAFDPKVEDYAIVDEIDPYSWIITDIVRGWYADRNTGMMFKASAEIEAGGTDNFKPFLSSDFTENDAYQPVLVIYFRNNNGLESYWDYTSSSAGRAGTGYINNYTGNLTWVRDDIGFGGNRMPVTISHVYNLNDAIVPNDDTNSNDSSGNSFGLGVGWRTNFNQLVYKWKVGGVDKGYYIWEDGDGTDHYFEYSSANIYKDEDGLELTLTDTGSGTEKYCITDKNGNRSFFDTSGRLTKQINNQAAKDKITITYVGSTKRISTITDGVGRVYSFTYNSSNLLTRIGYKSTGSTELSYVSFGYTGTELTTIADKDNKACTYTYSGNLLESAADIDGYKLTYTYNTVLESWQPYRVKSVAESDGNTPGGSLTFAYAHNETRITDYNNNTNIYQFNDFGNTICIQDDEGHAQFSQFARMEKDDDAGKANQLKLASQLQSTVTNLLSNGSFESTLDHWNPNVSAISRSTTTGQKYIGKQSLRAESTAEVETALLGPSFGVAPGESLTFSAYLQTTGIPCHIGLHDYVGYTESCNSETVTVASKWTRVQVTYTNDTNSSQHFNVCLYLEGAGIVYMDGAQVERAVSASRYNLVENSDFRNGTSTWTGSTGTVTQTDAASSVLDNNVYKFEGSPTGTKTLSQRIDVSGYSGDSFVLAGWAKGDSAPLSGDRTFGIRVKFNNSTSTDEKYYLEYNPDADNWQYAAKAVIAPYYYDYIILEISYNYNVNTAFFDGIQLYKEEFGNSYTYDKDGNVISVRDLQAQTTNYTYENNDLTKIIQSDGTEMTYTYDDYHNVKTATTDEGLSYSFEYDTYGNNTVVSITSGGVTMRSEAKYIEDAYGDNDGNYLDYTKDALGKQTFYGYNLDTGVLNWVKYPEDTDATRTNYTYDSMYRMATAACTTDTGLNLSAKYTYTDDLLTKIETPSTTYNFTYGDFSLRTGVSVGNRTLATYHYTEETVNDRKYDLDRLDYGNGDKVQYEYDDKGRVTKQEYLTGNTVEDTVTYAYDNDGQLAKVYDSQSGITTTYTYDLTGRLVKYAEHSAGHDYSVAYSYNKKNQLSTVMEIVDGHDRESTYQYDDDGRITFFEKVLARRRYAYDAFGRVSSTETLGRDYALIFNTTYSYNDTASSVSGQVSSLTYDGPQYDKTYHYTYDNNGNILSVREGANTTTYVYDSANQLIRENNQAGNFTHTWTYDNAGNILNRKEYAYTTGSLVGITPVKTVTYAYGDSQWRDLLTSYDGQTITYDQIGNPLTDGTWTYTWQHGRQLASMTDGTTTWDYTYDANGLRTERTDGTDTYRYVYDGDKLTFMARNGLYLRFAYTPEGTPLSVLYKGTTYYYVTNLQGDVTAILSQNGYVMVEYTYDAWGNLLTTTGSLANSLGKYNPLRYRGYVYDYETGLYYLQSRYYNPEIGRFLNADGLIATGQSLLGNNMFVYCENTPVIYSDTSGNARNYCVMLTDSGGNHNPLIYRQDAYPCTRLTYGNYSATLNSCGVIATYNTLVLKGYTGHENSFPSILEDFEDLGYPLLNGRWGTWPTRIGEYMVRRGIESSRWMGFGDLDTIVQPGSILIVSIWHNKPLENGMHTFACARTEVGWDVYNRHYINRASSYKTFDDILEDDYLAYALIVY